MRIVEDNGGLRNTLAMEMFADGYSALSDLERAIIDKRVVQLGLCPQCGDKPTYQTPDGTYWDSSAHYWEITRNDD